MAYSTPALSPRMRARASCKSTYFLALVCDACASIAATQAATCLVAGVMTITMGLVANYPLALASGMGLNAAVAYQLVAGMKLPWQAAMGVVLLEGVGSSLRASR